MSQSNTGQDEVAQDQTVENPQVEEAERRDDVEVAPVPDKKEDEKKTERRFATYVFMSLKTTASSMPGLSKEEKNDWSSFNMLARSRSPEDHKNYFDCWKKHLAKRWTPTFSDIALLAVSAGEFEDLIALDNLEKIETVVRGLSNFKQNALDMDVPEDDLEPKRVLNFNSPYQYYYDVKDKVKDEEKISFQDTWNGENGLRSWLEKLPKPVCLVAHGGFFRHFCVLYCELKRIGASVPDDVCYADTMIGVRNYKKLYGSMVRDINVGAVLSLVHLHYTLFNDGTDYNTHKAGFQRALKDCRATLEVASAYGEKMLKYIDDAAVQLNMTPPDWSKLKMLNILSDNFLDHARIFVVVKPGQHGAVGEIIELFVQKGFKLVASRKLNVSEEKLQTEKYRLVKTMEFYEHFLDHLHSGKVVGMIFQGRDVWCKHGEILCKAYSNEKNIIRVAEPAFTNEEIARWFTVSIHNDNLIYKCSKPKPK